MWEKDNLGPSI